MAWICVASFVARVLRHPLVLFITDNAFTTQLAAVALADPCAACLISVATAFGCDT
jgi:hypothetical protein